MSGGMAERLKAAVLKTVVALASPGVRIPLPPLMVFENSLTRVFGGVPEWSIGVAC